MKPFLQQIAEVYITNEHDQLIDYCFVFPNKRSGKFFSMYLRKSNQSTSIQPAITTISDLVLDFSDGIEATRMEQLFILYGIYSNILREHGENDEITFDRFQYWGDIILSDFNDVDRYMVDVKQLFTNAKHLKEISANFLTEEQLKVIEELSGEKRNLDIIERFWNHIPKAGDNEVINKFTRLWEVLHEIYIGFNQELASKGLTYNGKAYREAANRIKELEAYQLPSKRYIFIGFNSLSTSEIHIFESLERLGIADFYWDTASPTFKEDANNAIRFLKRYAERFKSLYRLTEPEISGFPTTNIIGVPSNSGQTKVAGDIIKNLLDNGEFDNEDNAIKTAIVLPDESLFIPLLHSIPHNIKSVNITMGYPLRHTPIAALITNIVSMHLRSQKLHGDICFYFEDLFAVLSHPLIRNISSTDADKIITDINTNNRYNIPAIELITKYPQLKAVFTLANENSINDVTRYTLDLLSFLEEGLDEAKHIEKGFISKYREAVLILERLCNEYQIEMKESTYFHLIERLIGSETINFDGEPLKGVQIMGVLETRALDFDNIVILSMNERIFPRKHYSSSFIPNNLRHAYGMSTLDLQESIYAYYFYRLICRAKNIHLIYDSNNSSRRSGEMSRYLHQLNYLFKHDKLKHIQLSYSLDSPFVRKISIPKDELTMEKINKYRDPNSDKKLSPSAIDKYIHCPLQFYLSYIRGYFINDDIKTYMDEGTYGTIVHNIAQNIYSYIIENKKSARIEKHDLDNMIKNQSLIERFITESINFNFTKNPNLNADLIGENRILGTMMAIFMKKLLEHDKEYAPFEYVEGEHPFYVNLPITSEISINLSGSIDRIDRINIDSGNPTVRIIDYKTGADETKISDWAQIFDTGNPRHQKSVLQLFLYAKAYDLERQNNCNDTHEPIMPLVYKFRDIGAGRQCEPMKIGKETVWDYTDFENEFMEKFGAKISELFDPDIPFTPTQDENACKYCKFTQICDR